MRCTFATANTDQVNRQGSCFPVDGLASSIERGIDECAEHSITFGYPTCISHDLHRLSGWNVPIGIHLSGSIARQIIMIAFTEDEQDHSPFARAHVNRLRYLADKAAERNLDALKQRIGSQADGASYAQVNSTLALQKENLAGQMYPSLFETSSRDVDKDGLVSMRALLQVCRQVFPGMFHDPKRDVILFAHPYFRRNLSRLNSLNESFLSALAVTEKEFPNLDIRIKLDADLVGFPTSQGVIELEYWWGPKFDDDISRIKPGVTEHAANERTSFFESIERSQFWWKHPESRDNGIIRTFEAEELLLESSPSLGISASDFGCRYVHSEYSDTSRAITHFDGAIRAYSREKYANRRALTIDSAGKHSVYNKLFRIDGAVPVGKWKSLVCAFFRGNDLLPEYLGADMSEKASTQDPTRSDATAAQEVMVGYTPLSQMTLPAETKLVNFGSAVQVAGSDLLPFDLPPHDTDKFFKQYEEYRESICVEHPDKMVNLPCIVIAPEDIDEPRSLFSSLADAVAADNYAGPISAAFLWKRETYWVSVSICGEPSLVANVLRQLPKVISLTVPPSIWIEQLKEVVSRECNVDLSSDVAMQRLNSSGLLQLEHSYADEILGNIRIPPSHSLFDRFADGRCEEQKA
jgi:hypothetical protein